MSELYGCAKTFAHHSSDFSDPYLKKRMEHGIEVGDGVQSRRRTKMENNRKLRGLEQSIICCTYYNMI